MSKTSWRRLTFALPFLPAVFAILATILLFWQGGFGGGHGDLDPAIALLAMPAIFFLAAGFPTPRFMESSLLVVVWYPALLNSLVFWTPLAYFLFKAGRLQREDDPA